MATSVLSMILETKKRGTGGVEATRELQGVTKGLQSAVLAVGAVAGGLVVAQRLYRATVGETMEYAGEVRQLSSITGQGAEASSRLIQVFDDFDVSGGQVTTMLRTLAAQGLSPTIETIAQLSDRYLALAPGVERATFLQQNFGRSGADLDLAMSQGSATLLARNAAVERGFVLNQQQLDQAEELRHAEDALGDAWGAFATTIGTRVIPTVTDLIQGLLDLGNAHITAYGPHGQIMYEIGDATTAADSANRTWVLGMDNALDDLDRFPDAADGVVDGLSDLTAAWLTNQIAAGSAGLQMDVVRDAIAFLAAHPDITIDMTVLTTYLQTGGALGIGGGGGGGGLTASQVEQNAWRTSHGYTAWTAEQFEAAGLQHGGAFDVMGPPGIDRVPVGFMATAGERVVVQTQEQQRRGGGGLTINGGLNVYTELDEQILLSKFRRLLT
jgi:hypothetical protein